MLRLVAVVYTAFILGANGAVAEGMAFTGQMKKLVVAETPAALPDIALTDAAGAPVSLSDHRGKWIVANFWATWCAPCRVEMPSLDRLQTAMPDIAVVPVATGRNSVEGIEKFYGEAGIANLPVVLDPKSELARNLGIMGLPVTLIVNPEGEEVARLIGDAEWDSADALAALGALMAAE